MSLPLRSAAIFVAGVAILLGAAALHLGVIPEIFGGFVALIGAVQVARVRFAGRLALPGAEASATVRPGGDVGFDAEAEARENTAGLDSSTLRILEEPPQDPDTAQDSRTIPAGSSDEGSSPGPE